MKIMRSVKEWLRTKCQGKKRITNIIAAKTNLINWARMNNKQQKIFKVVIQLSVLILNGLQYISAAGIWLVKTSVWSRFEVNI